MASELGSDRRAEGALLSRARRGDVEALRGLVYRFSSMVWAACMLSLPDHAAAVAAFGESWERIFADLGAARRDPDLTALVRGACRRALAGSASGDVIAKAIGSATQLAAEGEALVQVPSEALEPVHAALERHAARLTGAARNAHDRRRRRLWFGVGFAAAVVAGLALALTTLSRSVVGDAVARGVRVRVIDADLVPLFRDCVSPPFLIAERDPLETHKLEQISLVLEEISNTPPGVTRGELLHLKRRVISQDLVDAALDSSDRMHGEDRELMVSVELILEEIANL